MSGGGNSEHQQKVDNQVAQQQLAIEQQQLAKYNDYVNKILSGGGYLPGVRTALNANAINSVPQAYNQLSQQLLTTLGSRGVAGGGSQPGSGLLGRGLGDLYASEANQRAQLLNNITAQGQQNIAGAEAGVLGAGGIAGNVGGSALGGATNAAANADQAQSSLLGGILGGGLGILGKGLTGGFVNPFGGGGGGSTPPIYGGS